MMDLYERLPFVQVSRALTGRVDCSFISGLVAARLATAGPDEIRWLAPHFLGELEVRTTIQV
jgi:hypothetical protein